MESKKHCFKSLIHDLKQCLPCDSKNSHETLIVVLVNEQKLYLLKKQKLIKNYLISTAEAGLGYLSGSNKTPLGAHKVKEKFGQNAKLGSIFKGRVDTKKVATILTSKDTRSKADNITSRILWLSGLEEGVNKGTNSEGSIVDSHQRYIYIHGTDEEGRLGTEASHGCIRMANSAIIELFEQVETGSLVVILEKDLKYRSPSAI